MFMYSENLGESGRQQKIESTRAAVEICRENYAHVKENRALKQQSKIDAQVRSDHDNKMMNQNATDEKAREEDNLDERTEYREFLLKQINDKERQKHKQVGSGMTSVFNEEFVDPVIKNNLKLMKQQETRNALDECIRLKNERKQASKQKEVEEENERMEFLKKRENSDTKSQEQALQLAEKKEMWKYEVASAWRAENNNAVEREKFIDTLIEKDLLTVKAGNEKLEDQLEAQKKINFKRELLKQMEERNQLSAQQAADEKKEFQKLLAEVAKDEEIQQKLKDEEKQKKIEFNKSVLNSLSEKAERLKMDSNDPWK